MTHKRKLLPDPIRIPLLYDEDKEWSHDRVIIRSMKDCLAAPSWGHLKSGLECGIIRDDEDLLTSQYNTLARRFIRETDDMNNISHKDKPDLHASGIICKGAWTLLPAVGAMRRRLDDKSARKRKERSEAEKGPEGVEVTMGHEGDDGEGLRLEKKAKGKDRSSIGETDPFFAGFRTLSLVRCCAHGMNM